MKNYWKRLLALFLALALCMEMLPSLAANAAVASDPVTDETEAVVESAEASGTEAGVELSEATVTEENSDGDILTEAIDEETDEGSELEAVEDESKAPDGFEAPALSTKTAVCAASASTQDVSGTSDNISWTVADGVLTISGEGTIPTYSTGSAPWYSYRSSVTSIVIEEGITDLGKYAFYKMTAATSVSLPSTLEDIGTYTFAECSALKSVEIPDLVTEIGYAVFANCKALKSIDLNNVTTIGDYAFQAVAITEVTIPSCMTSISGIAFFNCYVEKFTTDSTDGTYIAINGVLYADGGATLIAYPQAAAATTFTIPSTVTRIERGAFAYAKYLTSVTIPESVTYLGSSAFQHMYKLESITIPDSVTEVDDFTFYGCPMLTTVTFGEGLTVTSYQMFRECSALTTINFGSTLTTLYAHTFAYCTSLESVTLPENIKSIGNGSLAECYALTTFVSTGIEGSIPYSAFWNSSALSDVTLNEGVTKINRAAFYGCKSLKTITLPESVEYVHFNAFPSTTTVINKNTKLSQFGGTGYRYLDEVSISGTRYYDMAYEVLELVNEEREAEGLSALVMDESLLETAMTRGAEIAILFAHTRPDGSTCFRANSLMVAENVAAGQASASAVMTSWMNSSGHKANILGASYTTIGIGCFYHNGTYYWVQCFGTGSNTADCTQPSNSDVTNTIKLAMETFDEATESTGTIWGSVASYTYQYGLSYTSTLSVGDTTTVTMYLTNPGFTSRRAILNNTGIDYTSSNTGVAFVDSSGVITALKGGSATISAALEFTTVTGTLTVEKESQEVSAYFEGNPAQLTIGSQVQIIAEGIGTITYTSSDTSVATVDESGLVTAVGKGTLKVTVAASGDDYYKSASKTITLSIIQIPISSCTVTLEATSYVYDGTQKKPAVTVTYGSRTLEEGTDYTLTYTNNTNAGTATVTVTGTGNATGSVSKTFTIEKAAQGISVDSQATVRVGSTVSLGATAQGTLTYTSSDASIATVNNVGLVTGVSAGTAEITVVASATGNYNATTATVTVTVTRVPLSECEASLSATSYVYDGSAKTPTVTVKYGTTTLTQGTDYTVSYTNNTNVGTATVTVTGIGKYEGIITETFAITKASQTLTATISSTEIRVGSTAAITASGQGTITYASDNTAVATVSASGVITGVGIGTANITVTAAGNNNYTAASRVIQVTVKKKVTEITGFTVTLSATSYTYDGAAKKPAVTVKTTDGATLTKGTDYTVAYTNNTNPGTATVTIIGIGDYEGTITLTFTIKLASCSVKYINNTMYGFKVAYTEVKGASGYYIYIRKDDGTYDMTTPTGIVEGGDVTVWTDPQELVGAKDYTYKVAAYYKSSDGTIIVGPSGTTKTCKYLKWGEVESVTNTTSGLKVTWTKVAGANGYYIYRKAAGEDEYTQVATVTVKSTSTLAWTDTSSLTSGKNYTYKVSAIFTNSKGQVTKGGALTTKTAKYLTAGKISSLSNTANGVYIKWSKVTGATGYYVYRKASSASSYTLVKTITSVGTTTYSDTTVKSSNNVTYTYYIQPYFKSSSGAITKAAYTTKTIVRLVAPTISSLTNSASKTMTVKWGTKSGVTGYQVQYSANSSFSSGNKTLTVTGASSSSKVISSLTKGKTYYVRIRTYKTVNGTTYYSAWGTAKSVKISK